MLCAKNRGFLDGPLYSRANATRPLVTDAFPVSLEAACAGVRLLLERGRIVGEGAAGLPVAAAVAGKAGGGRVVCIVSGGNIDASRLRTILDGGVPD